MPPDLLQGLRNRRQPKVAHEVRRFMASQGRRAVTDRAGVPKDGTPHGIGRVASGVSRGPGVPVVLRNPLGKPPVRIQSWQQEQAIQVDAAATGARTITIVPADAPAGVPISLLVE